MILADIGVPMIFITLSSMVLALIPIIIIEALVFWRILKISFVKALGVLTFANLTTTIIGIPFLWFLQMIVQQMTAFINFHESTVFGKILFAIFQGAWMPSEPEFAWVRSLSQIIFLIPAFGLSLIIELIVTKPFLEDKPIAPIKKSVLVSNILSYSFLLSYLIYWLVTSLMVKR